MGLGQSPEKGSDHVQKLTESGFLKAICAPLAGRFLKASVHMYSLCRTAKVCLLYNVYKMNMDSAWLSPQAMTLNCQSSDVRWLCYWAFDCV